MRFESYLDQECRPALGCTEPACIAFAAANATELVRGSIRSVRLTCDPRIYKYCYAVGIPHSDHRIGIRWSLAIGALLPDPSARLQCFRQITPEILRQAQSLLDLGAVTVEVDPAKTALYVDCSVTSDRGLGRAVIEQNHTRLTRLERDGVEVPFETSEASAHDGALAREIAALPFRDLIAVAQAISLQDRLRLREGAELNLAIARHGLSLFPAPFRTRMGDDISRSSRLVCAGVYARMSGEDFVVMSVAGSGNKGIVCTVPLVLWGHEIGAPQERIDEALALACLVTSLTTEHLGTLSAVCGCSNAAGIGLAAGLVLLEGGSDREISLAINNMVGNVTGMVCDGAKMGCALKTMTAVDAAFRAATLAMCGVGIPVSDGIVGSDGSASLANMGRIANLGMVSVDREILSIMTEKMQSP
ncbi:MAG TPA: L-serine ammonia-lyase, iron-sulfur-dependent, subunit alpha [Polyangiaceae bacterium]|nr:L-serine ammonia-lyase, iron-sulfur-dependent, subunit alpha [Polyangiaceae bacterium]